MNCQCSSLLQSIQNSHKKCIDSFSKYVESYIDRDLSNGSPIGYAAFELGDIKIVKQLLKFPHLKNIKSSLGFSPVHEAIILGELKYIKLFFEEGCDFNQLTDDGKNVFHLSVKKNNPEIISFLTKNVSTDLLNSKDNTKKTPIDYSFDFYEKNIFVFEEEEKVVIKMKKCEFIFEKEE